MGVEPTGDRIACRPPVLKTGTITGPHALPLETRIGHGSARILRIKPNLTSREGSVLIRSIRGRLSIFAAQL